MTTAQWWIAWALIIVLVGIAVGLFILEWQDQRHQRKVEGRDKNPER